MKALFLKILGIFSLIFMMNCQSQNQTNQNIERKWMLVNFKNYDKNYLVKAKAYLDLTNSEMANANMGCNSLSFPIKKKTEDKISFTGGISTMMACQNFMDLEQDFSKELANIKTYKIEGHFLTLSDENGNIMKFVAEDWD